MRNLARSGILLAAGEAIALGARASPKGEEGHFTALLGEWGRAIPPALAGGCSQIDPTEAKAAETE